VAAALAAVRVEPVLTARPNETKCHAVLDQHRALYLLVVQLENQMWTPYEKRALRDSIKAALGYLSHNMHLQLQRRVSREAIFATKL